jgi:hypothetical protein
LLERFTCGWINVDGQMTIKQSAPFGSHSRKGSAVTAPPVVGNGWFETVLDNQAGVSPCSKGSPVGG